MASDQTSAPRPNSWHGLLAFAGWWAAIVAVLLLYVRSAYPNPSPSEFEVIRIVIALAIAGIAVAVPGAVKGWVMYQKIGLAGAAALALFGAAYLYSPARLVAQSREEIVLTYIVCLGEYEGNCGFAHDKYLYCYENPTAWIAPRCSSMTASVIGSHDGNKCGYTRVQVLCRAKAP